MTYWLFGTVICSTLYFLDRFTNVNIIEEEKTFQRSPNMISKVAPITTVSEITQIENIIEFGVKLGEKEHNGNENGVFLLKEVVTEATKVANKSQLQKDFDQ